MTSPGESRYVLDSFAVLAVLQDEPGAPAVEDLIGRAVRGEARLWMSVVNFGEVIYQTIRRRDVERAQLLAAEFEDYPITLVEVDRDLALASAIIKADYPMSFADCIAAALAQRVDAPVVTGDPEFQRVGHFVRIEWLPRAQ